MLVISSREFRNNQAQYFDLADSKEHIVIQRGRNKAYRLLPVGEDDYISHIPEEFLCDPFSISPSGDVFWADKRNIERLKRLIEHLEKDIKDVNYTVCETYEDSLKHLDSL